MAKRSQRGRKDPTRADQVGVGYEVKSAAPGTAAATKHQSEDLKPMSDEYDAGPEDADVGLNDELASGIAAAYGSEDADLNQQTCCPNCETVFEVTLELLSSSDTRVRCGECLSIFDALINLREKENRLGDLDGVSQFSAEPDKIRSELPDEPFQKQFQEASNFSDASAALLAGMENNTSALDVTYADMDLYSPNAGLPELEYLEQTRGIEPFDFNDTSEEEADDSFGDTLFAQEIVEDARSTPIPPAFVSSVVASAIADSLPTDQLAVSTDKAEHKPAAAPAIFSHVEARAEGTSTAKSDKPVKASAKSAGTAAPAAAPSHSVATKVDLTPFDAVSSKSLNRNSSAASLAKESSTELHSHATSAPAANALDSMDELLGTLSVAPAPHVADKQKASIVWGVRTVLVLLVVALAALLYGYRERDSLLNNRWVRPVLETTCSLFGCTLDLPVDLKALQVLRRSVFSHPNLDNVLVINVSIVNRAPFDQAYPALEIRLTDRTGGLVSREYFEPQDYLENWQPGDVLEVGLRLDILLNVKDPGNEAMSFELDFRKQNSR